MAKPDFQRYPWNLSKNIKDTVFFLTQKALNLDNFSISDFKQEMRKSF